MTGTIEVRIRLKEFLEAHNLSTYSLTKAVKGLTRDTVYGYAAGRRKPTLDNLGVIVGALSELTGKTIEPSDLLEFVPLPSDPESENWLEAGAQDAASRIAALESQIPAEELKAWRQANAKAVQPARFVPGKGLVLDS